MSPYIGELAGIMAVFSFAIVAPGADTAMVMRQSLMHGRRAGILTAFGVGTSLLFHLTYTILGLGLIFTVTGTIITMGYGVLAGLLGMRLGRHMGVLNKLAAVIFGGLAVRLVVK